MCVVQELNISFSKSLIPSTLGIAALINNYLTG